jgi:hypothetical protein
LALGSRNIDAHPINGGFLNNVDEADDDSYDEKSYFPLDSYLKGFKKGYSIQNYTKLAMVFFEFH